APTRSTGWSRRCPGRRPSRGSATARARPPPGRPERPAAGPAACRLPVDHRVRQAGTTARRRGDRGYRQAAWAAVLDLVAGGEGDAPAEPPRTVEPAVPSTTLIPCSPRALVKAAPCLAAPTTPSPPPPPLPHPPLSTTYSP